MEVLRAADKRAAKWQMIHSISQKASSFGRSLEGSCVAVGLLISVNFHMKAFQLLKRFGGYKSGKCWIAQWQTMKSRSQTASQLMKTSEGFMNSGCWTAEPWTLESRCLFIYTRRLRSFSRGLTNSGGLILGLSSAWSGSLLPSGKRRR